MEEHYSNRIKKGSGDSGNYGHEGRPGTVGGSVTSGNQKFGGKFADLRIRLNEVNIKKPSSGAQQLTGILTQMERAGKFTNDIASIKSSLSADISSQALSGLVTRSRTVLDKIIRSL